MARLSQPKALTADCADFANYFEAEILAGKQEFRPFSLALLVGGMPL
jgi:hypothetical protein